MRMNNQLLPAAANSAPPPFAGLGLVAAGVREMARLMTPVFPNREEDPNICRFIPVPVAQPGGYRLLVALSREIRGR